MTAGASDTAKAASVSHRLVLEKPSYVITGWGYHCLNHPPEPILWTRLCHLADDSLPYGIVKPVKKAYKFILKPDQHKNAHDASSFFSRGFRCQNARNTHPRSFFYTATPFVTLAG